MRRKLSMTAFLVALLLAQLAAAPPTRACTAGTQGQGWLLDVPKGTRVVLKIPGRIIGFEKVGFWSGSLNYGTVIEQSAAGGLIVGGLTEWRTAGWTLMRQLTVEKVSRNSRLTEVELRDPLFNVKLRFDTTVKDLSAAFRDVAFVGLLSEFEASEDNISGRSSGRCSRSSSPASSPPSRPRRSCCVEVEARRLGDPHREVQGRHLPRALRRRRRANLQHHPDGSVGARRPRL